MDQWFEKLYIEHSERLLKVAERLLDDKSLAWDLVHGTFEQLLLHPEVKDHPNPAGWLHVTLDNLVTNENRRSYKRAEVPLDDKTENILEPEAEIAGLDCALPPELSQDDRQILIMYFERQLSYKQMSLELGITPMACGMRLSRAKARYKKILEKNEKIRPDPL